MGVAMNNQKKTLNCLIHGDYVKFITDQNMQCPHCESENERRKEIEAVEKVSLRKTVQVVDVTVNCLDHGLVEFKVPSFMANQQLECPQCVSKKRNEEIQPVVEKVVQEKIRKSGIPVNYLGERFTTLDHSRSHKQQAITKRLIDYVVDMVKVGSSDNAKNILLCGNMGTGKTLYASILLQEVVKRSLVAGIADSRDVKLKGGLSVLFISETTLLNDLTATWKHDSIETSKSLIKRLSKKSILCIDDVGVMTSTNTHLLDLYAAIIDERYKRRLPTIITSNLQHDDLKLAIGARSADRFFEKNRVIVANFDWHGYRTGTVGTSEIEFL